MYLFTSCLIFDYEVLYFVTSNCNCQLIFYTRPSSCSRKQFFFKMSYQRSTTNKRYIFIAEQLRGNEVAMQVFTTYVVTCSKQFIGKSYIEMLKVLPFTCIRALA